MLLSSGMAALVPEDQAPRTSEGRLLLGGLFGVEHKQHVDRLIYGRRPQNAQERRLRWARLPLGAQFGRVLLRSDQVLRGSGDDICAYVFWLKAPEGA